MIVAMQETATEEDIQGVIERLVQVGFNVHRTTGAIQTVLAGVGTPSHFDHNDFKLLAGVADVVRISSPYKLAGRGFRPEGTIIRSLSWPARAQSNRASKSLPWPSR
jgi:3-deoxy-7-phosphoheptulonate synthase